MEVVAVLLEVGMKAADDRNLQAPRDAQRGPAQRALGRQIDGIRAFALPQATQLVAGRQPPLQAGVAGDRHTAYTAFQQVALPVAARALVGQCRAYQLHAVLAREQATAQLAKGVGDAVDLRGIGFSDQCEAAAGRVWYGHAPSMDSRHDRSVTSL